MVEKQPGCLADRPTLEGADVKVEDLIKYLSELPQGSEVMILDGFNGGGSPRKVNLFGERIVTKEDAHACCDCEGLEGRSVFLLGYGSY